MVNDNKKTAVVLLNLGGPDSVEAVKPFLFNLFYDPAILRQPNPVRYILAKIISGRREKAAIEIYKKLGGKSPIVEMTEQQRAALEKKLGRGYKVFISMRYWYPRSVDTIRKMRQYNPDEIILLPLYPQFSTTTTASAIKDWQEAMEKLNFVRPVRIIEDYAEQEDFIAAHAETIKKYYDEAKKHGQPRLLFSAHGLPEKIIKAGDPYQKQIEQTVKKVIEKLDEKNPDHVVCYQSRVGPLKWLEPYTDQEIEKAAREKIPMVVVPIAFVSEHSETLVELDIEYKKLADDCNFPHYFRVPALGTHPKFIEALKKLVINNL